MGLGYQLLMDAHSHIFLYWIKNSFFIPQLSGPETSPWVTIIGQDTFSIIWASVFFMALCTVGINVALRYGLDEQIERQGDEKEAYRY